MLAEAVKPRTHTTPTSTRPGAVSDDGSGRGEPIALESER
jgi:hypothetical protein